jgi:AAA+ ATPase superfamily predicted ATPase
MKFYDRISEIAALQSMEQASGETAQMTMMVGRRRVGKTTLLKNAFKSVPFLYFFVAKKNEVLLCDEFSLEISEKLGIPIGSYSNFSELFRAIMQFRNG